MDRLTESGVTAPQNLTTAQAARVADERFGPDLAATLASMGPLVNQALHHPDLPDPSVADAAWDLTDRFSSQVKATQSRKQRIRSALDRRPLRARTAGGADRAGGGASG